MSLVPQNTHDSLCKHKHSDPALKIPSEIRKIPCRWQAPNPGLLVVPQAQVASRDQGSPPWSGARIMSGHTVSISPVSIDKVQRHCNPMGHQTGKRIPLLLTLESSKVSKATKQGALGMGREEHPLSCRESLSKTQVSNTRVWPFHYKK